MDRQTLRKTKYHIATFATSKMVAALGANILAFGISLYILQITGSAVSFAINLICSTVPRMVFGPIAGFMADTYSKKAIILSAQAGTILTMASLLTYIYFFDISLPAIYSMMVLYAIMTAFINVTFTASIASLVDDSRIQKAMAINQMSISLAAIVAPLIGGMLYGLVSLKTFLLIHICAYLLAFILESTMNFKLHSGTATTQEKLPILESMKSAASYINNKLVLKTIITFALCINLFFSIISVGLPFIIIEKLKIEALHVGFIEASGAIGVLVASLYFAFAKEVKQPIAFSKKTTLLLSVAISLFTIPLIVNIASYKLLILYYICAVMLVTILTTCGNTPIGVLLQKEIDEEYRGRVFGLFETLVVAAMPIGVLGYGFLFDTSPTASVFIGTSIILVILTLILLRTSVLKKIAASS